MDKQTLETYNNSAAKLAKYFSGINGTTSKDIKRAFELVNKQNPAVFEIGCGNGRDAIEILQGTNNYIGIDLSESMIKLAKKIDPNKFEVADINNYIFDKNYDIFYAFASLLHMDKSCIEKVIKKISKSLNPNGVISISLKKDSYQKQIKNDDFGSRTFYYYEPIDIEELVPRSLKTAYTDFQTRGSTEWFTITLQKTI